MDDTTQAQNDDWYHSFDARMDKKWDALFTLTAGLAEDIRQLAAHRGVSLSPRSEAVEKLVQGFHGGKAEVQQQLETPSGINPESKSVLPPMNPHPDGTIGDDTMEEAIAIKRDAWAQHELVPAPIRESVDEDLDGVGTVQGSANGPFKAYDEAATQLQLDVDPSKIGASNGEPTDESTDPSFTCLKSFSGKFCSFSMIKEVECHLLKAGVALINKAEEIFPAKTEAVEVAYQVLDEMTKSESAGMGSSAGVKNIKIAGRSHSSMIQNLEIARHMLDGMPKLFSVGPNADMDGNKDHVLSLNYILQIFDHKSCSLIDDGITYSFDPGGSSLLLLFPLLDFYCIDDFLTNKEQSIIQKVRRSVEMEVPTYHDFKKIEKLCVVVDEIGLFLTCEASDIELVGNELCKLSLSYAKPSARKIFNQFVPYISWLSLMLVKTGDEPAIEICMLNGVDWNLQTEQGWSAWQEVFSTRDKVKLVFTTMKMSVVSPDSTKPHCLVEAFGQFKVLKLFSKLWMEMKEEGDLLYVSSYKVLLEACVVLSSINEARVVFRRMSSLGNHGRYDEVKNPFLEMQLIDIEPNAEVFNILMKVFEKAGYLTKMTTDIIPRIFIGIEYAPRYLSTGLGGIVGGSPKALIDTEFISKTLVFSSAEREHYIWDPGLRAIYSYILEDKDVLKRTGIGVRLALKQGEELNDILTEIDLRYKDEFYIPAKRGNGDHIMSLYIILVKSFLDTDFHFKNVFTNAPKNFDNQINRVMEMTLEQQLPKMQATGFRKGSMLSVFEYLASFGVIVVDIQTFVWDPGLVWVIQLVPTGVIEVNFQTFVWDPGLVLVSFRFSTLRTMCSFRGGICHDTTFYYYFYMYFRIFVFTYLASYDVIY